MANNFYTCSVFMKESGVIVVNATPHPLNFVDGEEMVTVPSSVAPGEKSGFAVISAGVEEEEVAPGLVRTRFVPSEEGQAIIDGIKAEFRQEAERGILRIVGSITAANAYRDVVGMCPAPGFERVPPAEKRMSTTKFNVGECF